MEIFKEPIIINVSRGYTIVKKTLKLNTSNKLINFSRSRKSQCTFTRLLKIAVANYEMPFRRKKRKKKINTLFYKSC